MKNKITLIDTENGTFIPLGLSFMTETECLSAIAWQIKGGFDAEKMAVYGVKEVKELKKSGKLENPCFTQSAWVEFLETL